MRLEIFQLIQNLLMGAGEADGPIINIGHSRHLLVGDLHYKLVEIMLLEPNPDLAGIPSGMDHHLELPRQFEQELVGVHKGLAQVLRTLPAIVSGQDPIKVYTDSLAVFFIA